MKKVLIGVLTLILVFLGYVALQPANYTISREIVIQAKPNTIFPHLVNSRKADAWMPWSSIDPKAKITYSGPDEGVGSQSSWESEGEMGVGRSEIVEVKPDELVRTQLVYEKPMSMTQMVHFDLTDNGETSTVKWTVTGENTFVGRIFCVFMDMDKMVGGEFEKGLAQLKKTVETEVTASEATN